MRWPLMWRKTHEAAKLKHAQVTGGLCSQLKEERRKVVLLKWHLDDARAESKNPRLVKAAMETILKYATDADAPEGREDLLAFLKYKASAYMGGTPYGPKNWWGKGDSDERP